MNYFKKITAIAVLVSGASVSFAQDIHFSQYSETPVLVNPAAIATFFDTRGVVNYRTQWGQVAVAYKTYGFAFEQAIHHRKLRKNHFGVALSLYSDKAGDAKLNTLLPTLGVSYVTKVSQFAKFSAGLQAGAVYRTININNLQWDSQYDNANSVFDPSLPSGEETPRSAIITADAGGGIHYHYAKSERFISAQDGAKFDVGLSAFHYGIPKNSFFTTSEKLYTKYNFYARADLGIRSAGIALVPSILYSRQGPATEIVPGFFFKYIIQEQGTYTSIKKASAISFGAYYRVKDAIIPSLLYQNGSWAVGLAYDINVSSLTPASKSRGAFELSLRWNVSPGYGKSLGGSPNRPTHK